MHIGEFCKKISKNSFLQNTSAAEECADAIVTSRHFTETFQLYVLMKWWWKDVLKTNPEIGL